MHVHMTAKTTMARPRGTAASILVLLLVAMAGAADLASAAAFGSDDHQTAALLPSSAPSPAAGGGGVDAGELNGMIQCVMGCFTQVFGCALGCMGKGPDLPLCIISCDSKSVVCMIRCGLTPSPPGPKPPAPTPPGPKPKPPAPKPPAPKPPAPKPPPPGPPYTPPYAVAGSRKTGTYA